MFVPKGAASQVVAANAKGITLDSEQKTPSGLDALKAVGTAADTAILINPATAPVAGPVGLAADLTVSVLEKDFSNLLPTNGGAGAKQILRHQSVSGAVAERAAGAELATINNIIHRRLYCVANNLFIFWIRVLGISVFNFSIYCPDVTT